jgi:hypothetical protein
MAPGWHDFVSLAVFRAEREEEFAGEAKIAGTRPFGISPRPVIPGRLGEASPESLHATSFRGGSKSRIRNLEQGGTILLPHVEIPGSMLRIAPE